MIGLMLIGMMSAAALLMLVFKLGVRRVLGYDIWFDAAMSIVLMLAFQGTYAGMVAALAGGMFVSIFLWVLKKTIGYERLTVRGWRYHPPVWKSASFAKRMGWS